jgi:hypothetical protein
LLPPPYPLWVLKILLKGFYYIQIGIVAVTSAVTTEKKVAAPLMDENAIARKPSAEGYRSLPATPWGR